MSRKKSCDCSGVRSPRAKDGRKAPEVGTGEFTEKNSRYKGVAMVVSWVLHCCLLVFQPSPSPSDRASSLAAFVKIPACACRLTSRPASPPMRSRSSVLPSALICLSSVTVVATPPSCGLRNASDSNLLSPQLSSGPTEEKEQAAAAAAAWECRGTTKEQNTECTRENVEEKEEVENQMSKRKKEVDKP